MGSGEFVVLTNGCMINRVCEANSVTFLLLETLCTH